MKKFVICSLLIMTFLLPANKVLAEGQMDLDKKGSIEITFRDINGNIVEGGAITVRKVADLCYDNEGYSYAYTEQFSNSEISLDKSSIPELAIKLHEFAIDNEIDGVVKNNIEGKIKIENLTVGLYLISQKTASVGYSEIVPFLVSMPYQLDGILIYEVDASPKISPVNQEIIEQDPEITTEAPEIKPEDPEITTEAPEIKPEDPEITTEDPEIKPEIPWFKPGGADTGDKTPIMIYMCLLCISILVFIICLKSPKK